MTHQEIIDGLIALGYDSGWVVVGEEITLWERKEKQPTEAELKAALGGSK